MLFGDGYFLFVTRIEVEITVRMVEVDMGTMMTMDDMMMDMEGTTMDMEGTTTMGTMMGMEDMMTMDDTKTMGMMMGMERGITKTFPVVVSFIKSK